MNSVTTAPAASSVDATCSSNERAAVAMVWFTAPVVAVGFLVIGMAASKSLSTPYPMGWVSLGALAVITATFALKIPGVDARLSISDTFFLASVLLFGPAPATTIIAADSFVMSWRRGHGLQQLLFNPACSAIALWAGASSYYILAATPPLVNVSSVHTPQVMAPIACLAAVYFLLNFGLTSVAVALEKRASIMQIWRQHLAMMALNYAAAGSGAFFLVVLWNFAGLLAIIAALPLLGLCYVAMRSWLGRLDDARLHLDSINQLYLSTIRAFSTAIEAKDGVTSDHIHRVHGYALALARALDITDTATLKAIEAAALLHDTGKLAIPEHILNKPGALTPAEFKTMKLHVDVGVDILSSIDFPYPVVPIVRAHHENWNGTGYPDGLHGEQIPIGARIISVVDCYDALTSDRPYRSAKTQATAIDMILADRGTKYDPAVVDVFARVIRDITLTAPQRPELIKAVTSIKRAHSTHALPGVSPLRLDRAVPADASAELRAFVSLARVAAGNPSLGDIGVLAWTQLRHLLPDATLALYTLDVADGKLTATFTDGVEADLVVGHSMYVGECVTGWSAATSQPSRNAEAALDLPPGRRAPALQFALALPLLSAGVPIGVMTVYGPSSFSEECIRSVSRVTPHLAALLRTAFDGGDTEHSAAPTPQLNRTSALDPDRGFPRSALIANPRRCDSGLQQVVRHLQADAGPLPNGSVVRLATVDTRR